MEQKIVALIAGGYTGEYEVSLNSARNILQALDSQPFTIYTIFIRKEGWFYETGDGRRINVDKNDFSLTIEGQKILFNVALITIHGAPGEDGRLQGYLDMMGIPYTNCDTTTSSITMNKGFTKELVKEIPGLNIARSVRLFRHSAEADAEKIGQLAYPLFIKPNNGGSSVGMSKIASPDGLPAALEKAFGEDEQVLVEEFISGREFSIGLYAFKGKISVLSPTEIISSKDFFDYEAKYIPGISREITPADLDVRQVKRISAIVSEVYRQLNCKGMARIDFILNESGEFYFIEINTTPGQSSASIYPQQLRHAGWKEGDFYAALITEALEKHYEGS
jgi:D-alanine-D-alanine ligase